MVRMNGTTVQPSLPMPGVVNQKDALRDIRNYLAGQAIGFTRDEALLDEVLKCAFCRAHLERTGNAPEIQAGVSADDVAARYRKAFKEITERFPSLFDESAGLLLQPDQLRYIDRTLAPLLVSEPSRDLVGDIYEAFVGYALRGQEGQFFTPKNAVQLLVLMTRPMPSDTVIDPACGAGGFLMEAAKNVHRNTESVTGRIYGIDKDQYLARLARLRVALEFGVMPDVECADSLAWAGNGFDMSPTNSKLGRFSLVLTNPPFGSRIVAATGDTCRLFELAYRWSYDRDSGRFFKTQDLQYNTPPQVLFIERCLSLLAPGGRLGIVVPESVLCSPLHRYVAQYILDNSTIVAVIGMPESLFKTSGKGGTHTKVCLVVLKKAQADPTHKVFMAEAKWCGHDSRGKEIPNDDLPVIGKRFQDFCEGRKPEQNSLGFSVPLENIRNSILAPRYYDPEASGALRNLETTHRFVTVGELVKKGHLTISTGDELGKLAYGTGDVPFVRTSDLSNWEIKIDPKHCVSQDIYLQFAAKQDVREGDILMVRDGTYLIGTCAMVTKYDTKICFQSHIMKIRVTPSAPIDAYLLLALLSSEPVTAQIKAFSFTQDIIDSLGDRINDVLLPIPRSAERRTEVSKIVKKVIEERIEARELARKAKKLVCQR
jgi:type I restriction enzyme M protein